MAEFTPDEQAIIQEVRGMLADPQITKLREAYAAEKELTVHFGARYAYFDPGIPANISGFTDVDGNGFTLGKFAFSSDAELKKTFLHEMYRLRTSKVLRGQVDGPSMQEAATAETRAASGFADRAFNSVATVSPPEPTPDVQPMAVPLTYSIRGQANGAAVVALFMDVDALAHYFNDKFLDAAVKAARKQDLQSVREWQKNHPGDGALVVLTFRRTVPNSDFMQNKVLINPGDELESSSIYFAPTPDAAVRQLNAERECVQGDVIDGPYKTVRRKQAFWVAPKGPAEEAVLFSPVGRWQVSIGDWKGWFVFRNGGGCEWSDGGGPHLGTWKAVGNEVQWTYRDDPPGWERVFHARLPLKSRVNGEATIKGVSHGYYTMSKVG